MLRHIAIDEQNTIVNLYNLDEIDANKHTYFCIACGKEVFVDVDDREIIHFYIWMKTYHVRMTFICMKLQKGVM